MSAAHTLKPWSSLPIDLYVLALLSTVALGTIMPASGTASVIVGSASAKAVGLLFFLYGVRLSTREAMDGLRHWRLHLTILAYTFIVFPLFGLATGMLVPAVISPQLHDGLLFLCLVPSAIQASISFTSIARGNVPAAICAGSFSSIAGIGLTPLLSVLLLGNNGGGISAGSFIAIAQNLLVPFLAGNLLHHWVGNLLIRHERLLGYVDRGSVLLVVYSAFSKGMEQGIWHQVSAPQLGALAAVEAVLLTMMLVVTWYGAKQFGFERGDRIVIQFAGSKKSLAAGLPMASVLFGAQAALAALPLMLFHQLQLVVCAVIAKRRARDVLPDRADS